MTAKPSETKPAGRFTCGHCFKPCPGTFEMWHAQERKIASACEPCSKIMKGLGWRRLRYDSGARPGPNPDAAVQAGRSALPAGDRE